jgi:AraC family transcriptional regulator
VNGAAVAFPRRDSEGRLWLRDAEAEPAEREAEDHVEVEVHRRLADEVPLALETRITLRVSGAARHDIDFGPAGARCLVLEAEPGPATSALAALPRARFLPADGWLARIIRRIEAADPADPASTVVLDGLSSELLAQVERRLGGRDTPPPPWLERVRELVEDRRGNVAVAELAREAEVHRVQLARQFRTHFGVPVTEYARRVRIETAQRLLVSTDTPLAQVAARAGFADQAHLTRVLRATLGATPGSIRRSALHRFKTAAVPGC